MHLPGLFGMMLPQTSHQLWRLIFLLLSNQIHICQTFYGKEEEDDQNQSRLRVMIVWKELKPNKEAWEPKPSDWRVLARPRWWKVESIIGCMVVPLLKGERCMVVPLLSIYSREDFFAAWFQWKHTLNSSEAKGLPLNCKCGGYYILSVHFTACYLYHNIKKIS